MSWQDAEDRAVEQLRALFRQSRMAMELAEHGETLNRLEDVVLCDGRKLLESVAQSVLDEQVAEVEKKRVGVARNARKSAATKANTPAK